MSFSHSFFEAASSNSDMGPLVVLFVLRPTATAATHVLVVLHASSDLSRPGAAAAVQPPCTASQA
jgi:hypothetical protein